MKKVREFVRNLIDDSPWLVAIVIFCVILYLLKISGVIDWDHRFVESFWTQKVF